MIFQPMYDVVSRTPTPEMFRKAASIYEGIIEEAAGIADIKGKNLRDAMTEIPGQMAFHGRVLADARSVFKLAEEFSNRLENEITIQVLKSSKMKVKYGTLKITEASKIASGDDKVVEMVVEKYRLEKAVKALTAIMDTLEATRFTLYNIMRIKELNLDDVFI